MRLSSAQTRTILCCLRQHYGADARVLLFGSRLDDVECSADVALLVETATPLTLHQRMNACMRQR